MAFFKVKEGEAFLEMYKDTTTIRRILAAGEQIELSSIDEGLQPWKLEAMAFAAEEKTTNADSAPALAPAAPPAPATSDSAAEAAKQTALEKAQAALRLGKR